MERRLKKTENHETQGELVLEQVKELIAREGLSGWKLAQKTMLKLQPNTMALKQAINHVMTKYKPDFFRPAIVSLCCQAVGGESSRTIPFGATLILLGRAIGIHDDIIDHLKKRNGRPTLFGKFGQVTALVVSDILMFKGFTLLRKGLEYGVSQEETNKILETIDHIWFEQGESETLETQSRGKLDITPQECLAKIRMRASELEAITRTGGILGNGSSEKLEALGSFGRLLGTMSLLRDELIDMLELEMLEQRIKHESFPLPIIYAMQDAYTKAKIVPIINKKRFTQKNLKDISKLINDVGGMSYVAGFISELGQKAYTEVRSMNLKKVELKLLIDSLLLQPENWNALLV